MSEILDPEIEIAADQEVASNEVNTDGADEKAKNPLLEMNIYTVMLLLALLFIVFAIFYLLGVLRTYSEGFPFSSRFPWDVSEFESLLR